MEHEWNTEFLTSHMAIHAKKRNTVESATNDKAYEFDNNLHWKHVIRTYKCLGGLTQKSIHIDFYRLQSKVYSLSLFRVLNPSA
ncbi:hypothetical protein CA54_39870 [Symmachiella macrocystis]|uniref:Uncharacterized protein n=1 Tax=Symmachiella macrocystis TaxID=2527985 RepID=A0A5C6B9V3_9PLAN|nr:hypothetical protein CA54_39870 [Symmachiella macrocystis]